jgi:TRAP-type C4-dicarboxylate transport system substrate-binding protein
VTFTRHRTAEFVVTINERLLRSLPEEHKRIIERAAREAEIKFTLPPLSVKPGRWVRKTV